MTLEEAWKQYDDAVRGHWQESPAEVVECRKTLVNMITANAVSTSTQFTFDALQAINVARCESPDDGFNQKLDEWSILEWAGAMAGEAGEATNVAKKMRRQRVQRGDDKATIEQLGEELADTICYAALTAARAGINLGAAVVAKFNKVSQEIGSTYRLPERT